MEQNHTAIHVYNNNTLSSCEWKPIFNPEEGWYMGGVWCISFLSSFEVDFCAKIFMKKFIDLQQPFNVMLVFIKRIHLTLKLLRFVSHLEL